MKYFLPAIYLIAAGLNFMFLSRDLGKNSRDAVLDMLVASFFLVLAILKLIFLRRRIKS